MTPRITSAFDGGNIRVVRTDGDSFDLEIVADHLSDFYQWFHFRLTGAAGRPVTMRIVNAGGSAYPSGWADYRACVSTDRATWTRVPDTSYADGVLTIAATFGVDSVWIAYFAPYSYERHQDLVARAASEPGVVGRVLATSLDARPIDCLTLGEGTRQVWLYGRQHPGETMAEWWMEGVIGLLTDPHAPVGRALRRRATFHIVPNMNPDGSVRGHLRTNAAGVNLNREWHAPTPERSPEVLGVREAMDAGGVDFAMDVHGDEAIPHVFLAGFEGIPSLSPEQAEGFRGFRAALARRSPDFQHEHGYPAAAPGKANLAMSTNQLAERFGCVAMTLELPFKDADGLPDPLRGWSPERSARLGADCMGALLDVIDALPRDRTARRGDAAG